MGGKKEKYCEIQVAKGTMLNRHNHESDL